MEAGSHGVAITSITTRGLPQDADVSPTKQRWTKPRVLSEEILPRSLWTKPLPDGPARANRFRSEMSTVHPKADVCSV